MIQLGQQVADFFSYRFTTIYARNTEYLYQLPTTATINYYYRITNRKNIKVTTKLLVDDEEVKIVVDDMNQNHISGRPRQVEKECQGEGYLDRYYLLLEEIILLCR